MSQNSPPPPATVSSANSLAPFSNRVRACARQLADVGDEAIGGLIDLTSVRLVRFATTITRNQHDAEDAVQAALIKVAAKPARLHQCSDPWAFLLRMVRNESLVILRRRPRWNLVGGLCDLLTHRRVDELQREEQYRAIWLALRTLPTEQSEVVVLKIWEEMTFAEIASVLEITPSTAASRYRYAMSKLTERLSDQQHDAGQEHRQHV